MIRLIILIFLSFLFGCEPTNSGIRLGGSDYFLEDQDQSHVYITKMMPDLRVIVVDQMVVDYKIVGHYLFVLQKVALVYDCHTDAGKSVLTTIYTNRNAYWVIDMTARMEFGPFTRSAYLEKSNSIGVVGPNLNESSNYFTNNESLKTLKACTGPQN